MTLEIRLLQREETDVGKQKIQPPRTGGPYTVRITRGSEAVELHNVLVGDVWLCGGQSNMGVILRSARNGEEEVRAANYPEIRFFTVARSSCVSPYRLSRGELEHCHSRRCH